ncbi:uncharacterized protein LOC127845427 [Dreissena polymorpha]|uniref:Uncharacterized protein n=1 Tax=Dreissena polymorpha TaxID=45954 RepID=A0A9D4DZR7_DREPO|nr:uncharacterized protein LOC127845427 [Dreissena polymorpha]KAH3770483.1 hypothetical protein DPMN_171770 [Dreissena polymorpha]
MSIHRQAFQRLHRAYPSLNLMIHVNNDRTGVQVVLPGLRYDDIDHTGQPNIVKVFDIMSHVETAAFGYDPSFLDYLAIRQQNLRIFVKALVMEIDSSFYETTTPKAPLDTRVQLHDVGNRTFTTLNEIYCGGKLRPSIRSRSVYAIVNKNTSIIEPLPDWWKNRFEGHIVSKPKKLLVEAVKKCAPIHKNTFIVPLGDTDHNERTRCASYLRYFTENTSIASRLALLKHLKSSFYEFHIKRLSMLYYGPTSWGDQLTSETWQGDNPLQIMCEISKEGVPTWFGIMELHENVFGLPELKTK